MLTPSVQGVRSMQGQVSQASEGITIRKNTLMTFIIDSVTAHGVTDFMRNSSITAELAVNILSPVGCPCTG